MEFRRKGRRKLSRMKNKKIKILKKHCSDKVFTSVREHDNRGVPAHSTPAMYIHKVSCKTNFFAKFSDDS